MVYSLLNKLLGDQNEKALKKIWPLVKKTNDVFSEYESSLSLEEIPKKTAEFKERIRKGESFEDLLPEAFALVKCACKRLLGNKWQVRNHEITWDMVPFDVQILGGIVLHQGKISEMKTGEGKTLVCTMPVYLNALSGQGVHVVTVNDYLAQRDAEWMGGLYDALGLTVGIIKHGQTQEEKREAYACDITYGTNNEFGFDYLRDNMATDLRYLAQRDLNYAIVDEVDSILIDEARTPLIISAPAEESTSKYRKYAGLVSSLKNVQDYVIDEKMKTATLTEEGIKKMEGLLGVENIYTDAGFLEVHHIEQALKALTVYKRDTDYVVKDDEIIIVDEFTGRLMPGRRYSDGLHQAIEAKENVEIKRESRTLATITFQNYFRLYKKLAGMTGTAMTEAEEFFQIYRLESVEIPTNKPIVRADHQDLIYKDQKGKYMAIVKKVKELNEKGAPILIGTISIEKSEILSRLLKMDGITHSVLNAKYHEKEAEIITQAGQYGAVTIATNMAGRGTDIKLGEEAKKYGLFVLGTERHESRRIDNQLRGRSGRQGDPGGSQFFLSMEDDIMRLFGGERVKKTMEMLKLPEDMPIQNKLISNSIESAQKKVEGRNFDIRKHLVSYDDVITKHRKIIYSRRRKILESENVKNEILLLIEKETEKIILSHSKLKAEEGRWEYKEIINDINAIHRSPVSPLNIKELENIDNPEDLIERIKLFLFEEYGKKETLLRDTEIMRRIERSVYLGIIDTLWMEHIDNLHHLRESVALSGYGQRDPLIQYKEEAYITFTKLLDDIRSNTVATLFRLDLEKQLPEHLLAIKEPQNIMTNETQVTDIMTGDRELTVSTFGMENPMQRAMNPVTIKAQNQATALKKEAGRNEPCPCGSGKKYKKCHGR